MSYGKFTVVLNVADRRVKLLKLWFGRDGSYYVTCPYHQAKRAHLFLRTVNYAQPATVTNVPSLILDEGVVDEDERRIKLSHHPDGFLQFSGPGIMSGRNPDGSAKGIGVRSWPLSAPTMGPSFSAVIVGAGEFESAPPAKLNVIEFHIEDLAPMPDAEGVVVEGFYFPPEWRRFVTRAVGEPGGWRILLRNPNGPVLLLHVAMASNACELPGFVGLHIFRAHTWIEDATAGFILSGSTGNLRRNGVGELLGDGVYCVYPSHIAAIDRAARLRLPSPAYRVEQNADSTGDPEVLLATNGAPGLPQET
jgi:hypothetical protein